MSEKKNGFGISRSVYSLGGVIAVLLILVFANAILSRANLRWDATADKLYSLSQGSHKILSNLEQDVTLKVFYTRDNVNTPLYIKTYAGRMIDFLKEYEYYSDGKIRVEVIDPQPDSEEEEWAQKYGVRGVNLPTGERIYFGLVAAAADQEEVIPTIDPSREEHLEYDITRIISRLQTPEKPKIGVISALPVFGSGPPMGMMQQGPQQEPWVFINELQKTYEVEEIPAAAESIDEKIDLLILLHPKEMSETLQYAVDQHVLSGKNVILFADPFCISDDSAAGMGGMGMDRSSVPEKLLKAWGLEMASNKVLADINYTTRLRNQNNQVEENPLWLSIPDAAINDEEIVTANLESILMPVAGTISQIEGSSYEYTRLITSTADSALVDGFRAQFGSAQVRKDFSPTVDTYDLAVRVRGEFSTAFPDGKPGAGPSSAPEEAGEESENEDAENKKGLTAAAAPATIIVVADADMLFDGYYVSRQNFLGFEVARVFNDNLNLLLNTTEMLTGSDALITIRSRGKFERPFTKVEELERKAQDRWLAKEQELEKKMDETNQKLQTLEGQKDPSQEFIISEKQQAEIEKFREEKQRINQELKIVRRNLRSDIEALETKVKAVNIVLMPLLVSLAGIGYALYRRSKSQKNHGESVV